MEIKQYKQFDFKPDSINETDRTFIFYASTNDVDRYGDIVEPTAFNIEKIQTLPILFNHNMNNPIGKTLWAKITEKGLLLKVYITDKTQVAKDVWELVKEGIIAFASVGFMALEYEQLESGYKFTSLDLFETSLTPTPANREAIALALKTVQSPELKEYYDDKNKIMNMETEILELRKNILEINDKFKNHDILIKENEKKSFIEDVKRILDEKRK